MTIFKMTLLKIFTVLLVTSLASCATVPAERTNNCACAWEKLDGWQQANTLNDGVLS